MSQAEKGHAHSSVLPARSEARPTVDEPSRPETLNGDDNLIDGTNLSEGGFAAWTTVAEAYVRSNLLSNIPEPRLIYTHAASVHDLFVDRYEVVVTRRTCISEDRRARIDAFS